MQYNKYAFYEKSVQTPDHHVDLILQISKEICKKPPQVLREDFCGTFQISCEWVKRDSNHEAIGLDLDPEPIAYGNKNNRAALTSDQKKRLKIFRKNVLSVTSPKSNLIVAGNFSFFIFKQRELLRDYFRYCLKSLHKEGLVILEMAGGPGMIEPIRERIPIYENKKRIFSYIWHQKSFDPITHDATYGIHFHLPSGQWHRDAFTYNWRLWTIPEVQEILLEAGFDDVAVYWETTHRGEGTGEYARMRNGDNAYSWIAQVVGIKNSKI